MGYENTWPGANISLGFGTVVLMLPHTSYHLGTLEVLIGMQIAWG
jgi:hypothetical protein